MPRKGEFKNGGETLTRDLLNYKFPIGHHVKDTALDGGDSSLLTCHDILDQIALHDPKGIAIVFDKIFLKRIIKSHILFLRAEANDN